MSDPRYRFSLVRDLRDPRTRSVGLPERTVGFIMVNPSTAEADDGGQDDPTIRKCIGFARRAGYDGLLVGNVSPLRATDPRELLKCIGGGIDWRRRKENNEALKMICLGSATVVLAWGATVGGHPELAARADEVAALARCYAREVVTIGNRTAGGYPRHPLMLPYSATWRPAFPEPPPCNCNPADNTGGYHSPTCPEFDPQHGMEGPQF